VTKAPPSSEQTQRDLFDAYLQPEATSQSKKPKANKAKLTQAPVISSRFLSIDEVAKRYSVGQSTVWRWVKEGDRFPAPVKLSPGTSRWRETDLLKFEAGASTYTSAKPTKTRKSPKGSPAKGSVL
jgi:predicted DNA-binding transcriptional regulator AlpA